MRSSRHLYFGIQCLFFVFVDISNSQQTCPPPDVPLEGNYFPRQNKYQPGDSVSYNCTEGFTLMGKEISKCRSNGAWSNPMPFCDLKAPLKSLFAIDIRGSQNSNIKITDNNISTCFQIQSGESIVMTLDKPGTVYAVRIFFCRGTTNVEIRTGTVRCAFHKKQLDTNQWVLINCEKNDVIADSIRIQDKSDRKTENMLCEVEIYVKEEEGCEYPPNTRVANGYFEVTRSVARLICEEGYQTDSNSDRLICERNSWVKRSLQCNEILCNPVISDVVALESEWAFVESVKKISAGTRRKLKCSDSYKKVGSPDTIVCQKDGMWTPTNATCVSVSRATSTKTIIIGVVGILVVIIIFALLGTTIHFVRKQRREVVVVYKQPTEGSVMSGSEAEYASAYYESIQSTTPQPPTSKRPTAQMLTEGYFTPLDSHQSLKTQPTPADIAFGTLKQSAYYRC